MINQQALAKVDAIRKIMAAKQYAALHELVVGISVYNKDQQSTGEMMTSDEQRAWQMTMTHLRFLSKYGDSSLKAEDTGKVWFAYPEEFEHWLKLGAPGVLLDELQAYLNTL